MKDRLRVLFVPLAAVALCSCQKASDSSVSGTNISSATLHIDSVNMQSSSAGQQACGGSVGMNLAEGDQIVVNGSGFDLGTPQVFMTDGSHDTLLKGDVHTERGGRSLTFELKQVICAPYGFAIAIQNSAGRDDNLHLQTGSTANF